ncbi:hypothetical protein HK405_015948, partial [Cladochytrium tenue]
VPGGDRWRQRTPTNRMTAAATTASLVTEDLNNNIIRTMTAPPPVEDIDASLTPNAAILTSLADRLDDSRPTMSATPTPPIDGQDGSPISKVATPTPPAEGLEDSRTTKAATPTPSVGSLHDSGISTVATHNPPTEGVDDSHNTNVIVITPPVEDGNDSIAVTKVPAEEKAEPPLKKLLRSIADGMIGRNMPFESPFGTKAQCYADYTASGKALESVEQFIRTEVMPTYGNTHTTTSVTGLQTTSFREEARRIIGKAMNCRLSGSGARDLILFTGEGSTSAISKFITAIGLKTMRRYYLPSMRPVIFTCPFSHHSNLLPWRELAAADVVEIPEAAAGGLDLRELERQLRIYESRHLKIGTFTAASNLTGLVVDADKVSKLLHKYGALSCWDYATSAPYADMDMNPRDELAYKDAVFFSGH